MDLSSYTSRKSNMPLLSLTICTGLHNTDNIQPRVSNPKAQLAARMTYVVLEETRIIAKVQ